MNKIFSENEKEKQPRPEELVGKIRASLQKKNVVIGNTDIRGWHVWLSLGIAVGL
ncbi:MAG: hypothetical protein G01um101466_419, partial [Parcubacteria group bacterium Gr01-1014_66]